MQFSPGCTCCGTSCQVRITLTAQCGGAPVGGATVSIAASGSPGTILDTQLTNASGQVLLSIPGTGSYLVTRAGTGYTTTTSTINVVTCPGPTNFGVIIPPDSFTVNFSGCLNNCQPNATWLIHVTISQRGSGTYTTSFDLTSTATTTLTLPWFTGVTPNYQWTASCPEAGYQNILFTFNSACTPLNFNASLGAANTGWFYFPEYACVEPVPTAVLLSTGSNVNIWKSLASQTFTLPLTGVNATAGTGSCDYNLCVDGWDGPGTFMSFTINIPVCNPNFANPCLCSLPAGLQVNGAGKSGSCAVPGGTFLSANNTTFGYTICPVVGSVDVSTGGLGAFTDTVTFTQ